MKAIIWDFNNTLYNPLSEKLYKDAKAILERASQQYKQALITSAITRAQERKNLIKRIGIKKFFDHIDINIKTKRVFLNVCEKFKCEVSEVYVIGDSYLKEISLGNKLGMKTIWFHPKPINKIKQMLLNIDFYKKINSLQELNSIIF